MKGNGKWVLTSIVRNVPKSPLGLQSLSTQVCVALPRVQSGEFLDPVKAGITNSSWLLSQELQGVVPHGQSAAHAGGTPVSVSAGTQLWEHSFCQDQTPAFTED